MQKGGKPVAHEDDGREPPGKPCEPLPTASTGGGATPQLADFAADGTELSALLQNVIEGGLAGGNAEKIKDLLAGFLRENVRKKGLHATCKGAELLLSGRALCA